MCVRMLFIIPATRKF